MYGDFNTVFFPVLLYPSGSAVALLCGKRTRELRTTSVRSSCAVIGLALFPFAVADVFSSWFNFNINLLHAFL